ncbi:MAG: S-layer homology domain-containing protein [Firmicutes bacterium]|nr:S-layer homology domain-containing protein [Bacillota bacterium]
MKNKFLSMLLVITLLFSTLAIMPVYATDTDAAILSDSSADAILSTDASDSENSDDMTPASPLHLLDADADRSGDGWTWDTETATLTLSDLDLTVEGTNAILLPANSTVVLEGDNTITSLDSETEQNALIGCDGDVTFKGNGSLSISADKNIKHIILSFGSVSFISTEVNMMIDVENPDGGDSEDAVVCAYEDIIIDGALIGVGTNNGISGLCSETGSVKISNNSEVLISIESYTTSDDSRHTHGISAGGKEISVTGKSFIYMDVLGSNQVEGFVASEGNIVIENSTVKIGTESDNSYAYALCSDGKISILNATFVAHALGSKSIKDSGAIVDAGEHCTVVLSDNMIISEPENGSYDADKKAFIDKDGNIINEIYIEKYAKSYDECDDPKLCVINEFSDLDASLWYHDGIHYCYENDYMNGVGDGLFAPDGNTSRAMIVTILYRMADEPEVEAAESFSDVADGLWYTDAVNWAASHKIVNGVGNNLFAPDQKITRQEFAAMLQRFIEYLNGNPAPSADASLDSFKDADKVADWATDAVLWAVEIGLVNGIDGNIQPNDYATRSQAAALIQRLATWAEENVEYKVPDLETLAAENTLVDLLKKYPVVSDNETLYADDFFTKEMYKNNTKYVLKDGYVCVESTTSVAGKEPVLAYIRYADKDTKPASYINTDGNITPVELSDEEYLELTTGQWIIPDWTAMGYIEDYSVSYWEDGYYVFFINLANAETGESATFYIYYDCVSDLFTKYICTHYDKNDDVINSGVHYIDYDSTEAPDFSVIGKA